MNLSVLRWALAICLALAAGAAGFAQSFSPGSMPPPASGRAFIGEKLTYEGKVSRLRLSLSIAELTFTVSPAASDQIVIKSEAVSKGTMLKMFRYSFVQQYESTVDLAGFRIVRTTKHDVQKQRVRDGEAVFDYGVNRVMYVETDPKDSSRPPRRIASEIHAPMNDMISAIYAVRLNQLVVGSRFEISVSDSGLVYKVPIVITKREKLSTVLGKLNCLRIEPEIFGPGRLIERKGKMVLWVTDDARHTPVRASLDTEYGKVEIKLRSAVNPS